MGYEWANKSDEELPIEALERRWVEEKSISKWIVIPMLLFVLIVGGTAAYILSRPRLRVDALVAQAKASSDRQDYREAVFQLTHAIELKPKDATLYAKRARVYYLMKQDKNAADDYRRASQLDEDSPLKLYQRWTTVLLRSGDFSGAMKTCDLEHDRSKTVVEKVVALNKWAYVAALAEVDLKKALKRANLVIKECEKNNIGILAACLDTRGFVHYKLGNYQEGLEDMERAVIGGELRWRTYRGLRNDKRYREYIQDLQHSMAVFYYHRALLYKAVGETDAAEADLEKVIEFGETPGPKLY